LNRFFILAISGREVPKAETFTKPSVAIGADEVHVLAATPV